VAVVPFETYSNSGDITENSNETLKMRIAVFIIKSYENLDLCRKLAVFVRMNGL
jgi:hypothetical protein